MIEYKIAAIPTIYRGRQYRSRLEARWAAFFDALGIEHEYEPFDLGQWSPDFLLPDLNMLVEVKPITDFDEDTWKRIGASCRALHRTSSVLLAMVAPRICEPTALQVGWMGFPCEDDSRDHVAYLGWVPQSDQPVFDVDIVHMLGPSAWRSARGELGPVPSLEMPHPFGRYAEKLWFEATNSVQWNPE